MLAVAGQSVAYLLAVTLARQLGVDGFEAYAVASAAFTLMVMYAPRGIEKICVAVKRTFAQTLRRPWSAIPQGYSPGHKWRTDL